jgi:hypothetical protein
MTQKGPEKECPKVAGENSPSMILPSRAGNGFAGNGQTPCLTQRLLGYRAFSNKNRVKTPMPGPISSTGKTLCAQAYRRYGQLFPNWSEMLSKGFLGFNWVHHLGTKK